MIKRVFVYGGKGALGDACVTKFKSLNWVRKKAEKAHQLTQFRLRNKKKLTFTFFHLIGLPWKLVHS